MRQKQKLPLQDAGAISVCMYNPTENMEVQLKQDLVCSVTDENARAIIEVLLGMKNIDSISGDAAKAVRRIMEHKISRGYVSRDVLINYRTFGWINKF